MKLRTKNRKAETLSGFFTFFRIDKWAYARYTKNVSKRFLPKKGGMYCHVNQNAAVFVPNRFTVSSQATLTPEYQ